MKVSTTAYRWVTFGIAGTIADLQETVEDYIGALIVDGTTIDWTYTDETPSGAMEVKDNAITLAKMEHGTQGDTYYCGAAGAPSRLATGTAGQAFIAGGAAADPSWGTLGVVGGGTGTATLTDHGVLLGSGTSAVTPTAAGTSGQPLLSGGASADPDWGTLGVAYGGTGATTLTDHGVLVGSGTDAVDALAVLTDGQLLIGVTGADPSTQACSATPGASTVPIADGSGKLDGWISIATAATPGLIEHLNWGDFVPVLVWADATPTGLTVVGRYRHIGNGVEFVINIRGADGAGGTLSSATLPVTPSDLNIVIPVCGLQKVDTTWTNPEAYIDAETDLKIEFKGISACTDDAAFEIALSGSYEVAAT